ncbi:MAG: prepilin-type N-terminal cleavage/methylation domain-containing protein [Thermoanaerobaculaceae bacterium]|nr:prepilin-type N-terminal cleavage/methylation domain-containing protein [Thermoanaerobaculaceae bacterium]
MRRTRSSAAGYTLIEGLVVLAIIGILAAWVVPNFRHSMIRSKLTTPVRDIERLSSVARLQALNAQRPFGMAFLVLGGGESGAVRIFEDADGDGTFDQEERVVQSYELPPGVRFASPLPGPAVPAAIVFAPGGALVGTADPSVYVGDLRGNHMRLVFNHITGQVRREMFVPGSTNEWLGPSREGEWTWLY